MATSDDKPSPRSVLTATEICLVEGDLDRAEDGLLKALSEVRRKRQEQR